MSKAFTWMLFLATCLMQINVHAAYTRPNQDQGPTKVYMRMYIVDIDEIDTAQQNFTANVFYELHWNDPRLAHDSKEQLVLPLTKVWHPRIQILNVQRVWKSFADVVEVKPDGEVIYRQRLWGSFSQPLKLRKFPFDKQTFKINFIAVGYKPDQVTFSIYQGLPSGIADAFSLPDWRVLGWKLSNQPQQALKGSLIVAGFTFSITAERFVSYYVFKFMIPLMFIVIMSFIVFWIDPSESSTRINVTVTAMLTLIAYRFIIATLLPKVSYLTRLDLFVLSATIMVFTTLLITATESMLVKRNQLATVESMDRVCRYIYPIMLIFIIILPFIVYR